MNLEPEDLAASVAPTQGVALTGGTFWHVLTVDNAALTDLVIDFRNSSVVGTFEHWVFAPNGQLVQRVAGGIQSSENNPFFLRHGREITLPAGRYQVITRLSGPFFLAQPQPDVFELDQYRQSIKLGNTVTLLGLGIFFAMGIYYLVLGVSRVRKADLLYAGFILGNLLYNGSALLVFNDLLNLSQFYLISFPILLSNMAYVGFVMVLLNINRLTSPRLYYLGLGIIALFVAFFVIALMQPHWSLEFCRVGVGIFALYGFSAGTVRIIQGDRTARYYLIANFAFVIPALISIQASTFAFADTLVIEHIGLFAVAVEVILLSLVVSHQVGMVYREKEAGLVATQKALQLANDALETKQRFLANVSHELRTPLNAIQGSVELISQHSLPPSVYPHIDAIDASSDLLLFLINDILDLAKMNAQQLVLLQEEFDLNRTIDDLVSIYKNAYPRDRVRLVVDVDPAINGKLMGDENRLKQIVANLLSNAFKFTEQGEVRLSVRRSSVTELTFSVSDTGIGIAPDKLPAVFSAFTQADASIARKYGGTGLGLQIASKLVRMMGGKLAADSVVGQGSDFHFILPVTLLPPEPVGQWETPVGLVCDDLDLETIVRQDLRYLGIGVATVLTPEQLAVQPAPTHIETWLLVTNTFIAPLKLAFRSDHQVQWFVNHLDETEALEPGREVGLMPYARSQLRPLLAGTLARQTAASETASVMPLSVIAVDDNVINLQVLLGMLKRLQVECQGFRDPTEAIERLMTTPCDVVLMDVQMPGMDGLE
ncbi:MAG: ATP-binding protein, partial [Natronospirillum sp.]